MKDIRFAVFTDLHHDHVFDSYERLKSTVDKIKRSEVDFVLNLGDFCRPIEANKPVIELLTQIEKPCYHAIGNHDSDDFTKEQVLHFIGQRQSYYSFIQGHVKFIVLDACYIEEQGEYKAYNKRNYATTGGNYPVLPPEQLKWLKNELNDSSYKYVIASHHSFENGFKKRGVHNRGDVQEIISEARIAGKDVVLCINGHDHADSLVEHDGTHYFGVNAMSYIWLGGNVTQSPYEETLYTKYPGLKDIVLYKDGSFATVVIKPSGQINIEGMLGDYKTVSPEEMGITGSWNGKSISPNIMSRNIG